MSSDNVKYYGHRGIFDNVRVFENTLSAFEYALKYNVGIELDVRMTQDHVLVVFHDKNLKRLFNENIEVKDLTYVDLKNYTFNKEPIPTLQDTLKLIDGKVDVIVEIKEGLETHVLCTKVTELLDVYKGQFSVESFDPRIVRWFKIHRPTFKRGLLVMPASKYESYVVGLLMRSFLPHLMCKPDFYAYEVTLGKHFFARFFMQLIAKEIVIWTHKPGMNIYLKHQSIIFEDARLLKETIYD